MSDFKVIETQEDFDAAIQKRLAQKEREVTARFDGYMSPDDVKALKDGYEKTIAENAGKIKDHDKTVADLTERATKAEKALLRQSIAASHGIPAELADRLVGDSKEDLEKDADALAAFIASKAAPPMRSTEPAITDSKSASLAKFAAGLQFN